MRRVLAIAGACTMIACGRTPTIERAVFHVATVDGADNPMPQVDVELEDGARTIATQHTDGDGVATFEYPGDGRYELQAWNDPHCCFGEGALDIVLREPGELFVVELTIGPCPTWSPTWCG